jgi:glutamate-5-semialdehyde dehydrogenase
MYKKAKASALKAAGLSSETKNRALLMVANALEGNAEKIFEANHNDLVEAENQIDAAIFERLKLDENKMRAMVAGIRDLAKLDDPINRRLLVRELDEDLTLFKISCPIGVLGVIFEARPDVIAQISALAIKSSNAVIMKGGSESKRTNETILGIINTALEKLEDFPQNLLQQIFSREDAAKMLESKEINLIIPRGSKELVEFVQSSTKTPVLGHADGICHIFADKSADFDMLKNIVIDSKTQYPSACNSVETLLIHKDFGSTQELLEALREAGINLVENPKSWSFEYSDKTMAYRTVKGLKDAIEYINTYGSGHTDCIVTNDAPNAQVFMDKVDSAGVFTNVSTRFSDGFRYGFGAEVGISTGKIHARGPVGLDGLTIYKYKLIGAGQVVKDYADGTKEFHHRDL